MPAEDACGSVVAIQDCNSLATCRVSFTAILTASDFTRYCDWYEPEELFPFEGEPEPCVEELPGCCAGAFIEPEPELEAVPDPAQPANSRARVTKPANRIARRTRLLLMNVLTFI